MNEHYVIVGGGQAASQAVQTLRQQGFTGNLTLIGEEPYLPYQRPPLSKKYLAGELPRERLFLRHAAFYAEKAVTLELGRRALELDLVKHTVRLDDGRSVTYDRLLLATGSAVRTLPIEGVELPGVHYLRTIADVDAIAARLAPGAQVLLVGAGYIGLEVAAVTAQRGFAVTVVEALDRVMARTVAPQVSTFYHRYHRERGVVIHYGAAVRAFHGVGRVSSVELVDGRRLDCDVAVIGIGVVPNVALARAAGLPCENGIVVDEHARTVDEHVFAAGDCTNQPLGPFDTHVRLESVPNAIHQAKVAASGMLGALTTYSEVPWFWSDQYDLKLQIAGLSTGYDEVAIRPGAAAHNFAAYYLAHGKVIAVDAVNSPHDFMNGKKLITAGAALTAAEISDPATNLAS
ncbi:MAG TPA: FAD-dependent oxidoreductase, partial [Gammaproteobacteria bacterium]|nr:FAD-dependent oxidoreductase [Gammaproteobacteria bacterium]